MGSGSSKETAVQDFIQSEDNDVNHLSNTTPASKNYNNNSNINSNNSNGWSKTSQDKKIEKKNEKKNPLSLLGRAFGKKEKNRKIVDLDSSESETDTDDFDDSKKGLDSKLKNEISDLETTFTRLGLDEKGRMRAHGRLEQINGHGHNKIRETGLSTGSSSGSETSVLGSHSHNGKKYVGGAKKTNNIRFSWDDRPFTETEENWTLSKVKIDGFDPEKFRVANNNSTIKTNNTNNINNANSRREHFILESRLNLGESMPGSVPSYDPHEQQLLASIEREMGVL